MTTHSGKCRGSQVSRINIHTTNWLSVALDYALGNYIRITLLRLRVNYEWETEVVVCHEAENSLQRDPPKYTTVHPAVPLYLVCTRCI